MPPPTPQPSLLLLRAINVSSSPNRITMPALTTHLSTHLSIPRDEIRTYLQSGNVVLPLPGYEGMARRAFEEGVEDGLSIGTKVILRTKSQMEAVVEACTFDTTDPTKIYYYAFTTPITPTESALLTTTAEAAGEPVIILPGGEDVIISYPNGAGRAKMSLKVIEKICGAGKWGTGRNWRTVAKVLEMMG